MYSRKITGHLGGVLLDGNYTNTPTPKKPEGELIAVCDSMTCVFRARQQKFQQISNFGHVEIVKSVPKTTTFCPDCGSALFWRRGHGHRKPRGQNEQKEKRKRGRPKRVKAY